MVDDAGTLIKALGAHNEGLWPDGNVASTRLGWLEAPRRMADEGADLATWAVSGMDTALWTLACVGCVLLSGRRRS